MFFCTFVAAHKPYQSLMIIDIERKKKKKSPTAHHKLSYKEPKACDGKHKIDIGQRKMGSQRKARSAVVLATLGHVLGSVRCTWMMNNPWSPNQLLDPPINYYSSALISYSSCTYSSSSQAI